MYAFLAQILFSTFRLFLFQTNIEQLGAEFNVHPFRGFNIVPGSRPAYPSAAAIKRACPFFLDAFTHCFKGVIFFAVDELVSTRTEKQARQLKEHDVWEKLRSFQLHPRSRQLQTKVKHKENDDTTIELTLTEWLDIIERSKGAEESLKLQSSVFFRVAYNALDRYRRTEENASYKVIQRLLDDGYRERQQAGNTDEQFFRWLANSRIQNPLVPEEAGVSRYIDPETLERLTGNFESQTARGGDDTSVRQSSC